MFCFISLHALAVIKATLAKLAMILKTGLKKISNRITILLFKSFIID